MTTNDTQATAGEETEQEKRAGFLELFFDLVFVFGITQVTALLLDDTSTLGFVRAALVFGLLWWAWSAYTWLTNAIDIERSGVRVLMLGAMAGSFFMALAVPEAYGSDGLWFAAPYVVVRVLQVALYAEGLRRSPEQLRTFLGLAPWFLVAPTLVLVGGAVDDPARAWLWAASLAIDVTGT
ncbi:MAG: low temperature requirement protein A, partial [Thermoleophilia bacterium]|nr:low temperature requirement protein A [Thermoleophilia bacterium]